MSESLHFRRAIRYIVFASCYCFVENGACWDHILAPNLFLINFLLGSLTTSATINLPTSGCGVGLRSQESDSGGTKLLYTVTLVAQQDRHLMQISDTERVVECFVEDAVFTIKSQPMRDAVEKEILGYNKGMSRYKTRSCIISNWLNTLLIKWVER